MDTILTKQMLSLCSVPAGSVPIPPCAATPLGTHSSVVPSTAIRTFFRGRGFSLGTAVGVVVSIIFISALP